jgi:AraC family transcriptional regulator
MSQEPEAFQRSAYERVPLVASETQWRQRPEPHLSKCGDPARSTLSRWTSAGECLPFEASFDSYDESHVVTLRLRQTNSELRIAGQTVFSGNRQSGGMTLAGPKHEIWRGTFRKPFDNLRIYIPQSIMGEVYETCYGRPPPSLISLLQFTDADDGMLTHLMRAALAFETYNDALGPCFLDSLGLAIAARLFALHENKRLSRPVQKFKALSKSRLDNIRAYIDEHLARPVYLAELCELVGLSQMQFTAQFRIATGYTPHAYIMQRRIEVAQELLRNPNRSIADVALAVGFSSQPHFTDTFRRLCRETPGEWRKKGLRQRG